MTKVQIRHRESLTPGDKNRPHLQIVREGEPVPEIAPPRMRKARTRKPRAHARVISDAIPFCPLCETAVTRFDADIFSTTGRCGPCHEAMTEA